MSYEYVIDAYAWIEYFKGSRSGEVAKRYIEEESSATPTVVIAELSRKLLREVERGVETLDGRRVKLEFIVAVTEVVDLTRRIAELAGEIDVERKRKVSNWGLADSIILATARLCNAKVVTGDKHFADLKDEVVMIEQF
ncbi:MAG: type II toxin-antitoxin system VapC family toxin [Thermofilaceae archaeon]|nr:type II toxin-antitoxin system VapC family toxin [Thermofilaceae archaeon]MCX8180258.1 type II toxin-antitoxin system VapC family toxin [Thermofilaceae archaeon]MDW8004022.1 type II toxin-antitoxin system VapC family toxin [Thermofilaceae archaeon]